MWVFDGKRNHEVAQLKETERWAEVEFDVSHDLFGVREADRTNYSGFNAMFEIRSPGVRIHSISVRRKK